VRPGTAPVTFDAAQHLVSSAVADDGDAVGLRAAARLASQPGYGLLPPAEAEPRSLRTRLARLLETVSGSQPEA
jgi:hypothetical protein